MRIQQTSAKIAAGEQEVSLFPRSIRPTKAGIIYAHGSEASNPGGMAWLGFPGRWPIMRETSARAPMICPELGGNMTWGNDTAIARMTDTYNYLQTLPGVAPGKVSILAQSMGAASAIAWAKSNAAKISRIVLMIPVINLTDVRNSSAYYQPFIDAAYGGTYSEAAYGADHNPLTIAQSGALAGIDVQLWYGDTDTLCKPQFALQFAAALGSRCELRKMGGGHSEETVYNIDPFAVAAFLTPET